MIQISTNGSTSCLLPRFYFLININNIRNFVTIPLMLYTLYK